MAKRKAQLSAETGPGISEAKLRLNKIVNRMLSERGLTQTESSQLLRINEEDLLALQGLKSDFFSIMQLMHFATALDHDVVIHLRLHNGSGGAARTLVVEAA
jgi:predicted XRE-type DNA-binding protein